jgi:hypothetical protein
MIIEYYVQSLLYGAVMQDPPLCIAVYRMMHGSHDLILFAEY